MLSAVCKMLNISNPKRVKMDKSMGDHDQLLGSTTSDRSTESVNVELSQPDIAHGFPNDRAADLDDASVEEVESALYRRSRASSIHSETILIKTTKPDEPRRSSVYNNMDESEDGGTGFSHGSDSEEDEIRRLKEAIGYSEMCSFHPGDHDNYEPDYELNASKQHTELDESAEKLRDLVVGSAGDGVFVSGGAIEERSAAGLQNRSEAELESLNNFDLNLEPPKVVGIVDGPEAPVSAQGGKFGVLESSGEPFEPSSEEMPEVADKCASVGASSDDENSEPWFNLSQRTAPGNITYEEMKRQYYDQERRSMALPVVEQSPVHEQGGEPGENVSFNGESPDPACGETVLEEEALGNDEIVELNEDELVWFRDDPSPKFDGFRVPSGVLARTPPHLASQLTDQLRIRLPQPVDYLVAYSDDCTAIAVVRLAAKSRLPDVPLVVRLGAAWASQTAHRLYVGCVVRVSELVRTMEPDGKLTEWISAFRGLSYDNMFCAQLPRACAFVTEYAVVRRPAVVRSLGVCEKAESTPRRDKRLCIRATVEDLEYGEQLTPCDSQWPPSLSTLPMPRQPVIVNWISIKNEDHVLMSRFGRVIILPAYLGHLRETSQPYREHYLFGWIDLSFKESRVIP